MNAGIYVSVDNQIKNNYHVEYMIKYLKNVIVYGKKLIINIG